MANKTLLNAVNEIFRRVGLIAGDAGLLTSLTDSARQVSVDQAVQAINEVIDELYSTTNTALPNEQAESTITLATGTRAYSLATDLSQLRWPLRDKTNSQFIIPFPGGYDALLNLDIEQDDTGLPHYGAIRPTDGKLHLDRAPTSTDNGKVYTYQYDKNTALSLLTDTVPFGDPVFRALIPAFVQIWKREARNQFDEALMKGSMGRASRLLTQQQERSSWSPR